MHYIHVLILILHLDFSIKEIIALIHGDDRIKKLWSICSIGKNLKVLRSISEVTGKGSAFQDSNIASPDTSGDGPGGPQVIV